MILRPAPLVCVLLLPTLALATVPTEDAKKGAKVLLDSEAPTWVRCDLGVHCEPSLKVDVLATILSADKNQAELKLENGMKVTIAFNDEGLPGVVPADAENMARRQAAIDAVKAEAKAKAEREKALEKVVKALTSSITWKFDGIPLGSPRTAVEKMAKAKGYGFADLGDNIWAINGWKLDGTEYKVHLFFNPVDLLYQVKFEGQRGGASLFSKTIVGEADQLGTWLSKDFGAPSTQKAPNTVDISDGALTLYQKWLRKGIDVQSSFTIESNQYFVLTTVKATDLESGELPTTP